MTQQHRFRQLRYILVDCPPASFPVPIIVNYHDPVLSYSRIELFYAETGGFIPVAIKTQQRDVANFIRTPGDRVLEPSLIVVDKFARVSDFSLEEARPRPRANSRTVL